MDDNQQEDQFLFSVEDVEKKVFELIEQMLNGVNYDENEVQHWINRICERVTDYLIKTDKPYKYIVNCTIMQKTGAGFVTSTSCHWDTIGDNTAFVSWPKEKSKDNVNKTMNCIVCVFATSV